MTVSRISATGFAIMKSVSSVLVAVMFSFPVILRADGAALPKFNPTSVGKGPVLVFKQPKNNSNELALYLFDPATHEKPRVIWQDRYQPNPRPLKRLSADVILIEFQNRLCTVDLPSGEITPLLAGKEQNKLVATEGKTIYFFQRTIAKTNQDSGIHLTTGKEDKTVVKKYFRPRDVLFRYEVGSGDGAKMVSPIVIEHLLEVTSEGFFVITADKPQTVARISRDGRVTKICPFESHGVASLVTYAISPKGRYLALSVLGKEQDFHEERSLMVCDLKENKVCFSDANVPLGPSFFSGRSNFLNLTWRADQILQYGGPFSSLGSEEEKPRFANVKLQVSLNKEAELALPPVSGKEDPGRESRGHFELKFGEVYFPGEATPVARVLDENGTGVRELAVDSQGQWAAYFERKDDQVYMLDARNRSKKAVHSGWGHDLKWLEIETGK